MSLSVVGGSSTSASSGTATNSSSAASASATAAKSGADASLGSRHLWFVFLVLGAAALLLS